MPKELLKALETVLSEFRLRAAGEEDVEQGEQRDKPKPTQAVTTPTHAELMNILLEHTARFDKLDQEISDIRRFILNPSDRPIVAPPDPAVPPASAKTLTMTLTEENKKKDP